MANRFVIQVPDVADLLALLPSDGYDQITVLRSTGGVSGPFVELTAAAIAAAQLTGTVAGPFADLNGRTLRLRASGSTVEVQFLDQNPVSTANAASAVAAALGALGTAGDSAGLLTIATTATGTGATLEILDGTALDQLGLMPGAFAIGPAVRIPLLAGVLSYLFVDESGTDDDYYAVQYRNSNTGVLGAMSNLSHGQVEAAQPKQQADTRAPRGLTVLRRSTHVFKQSFWKDAAAEIEMAPVDALRYPAYQVIDPAGQILQAGVAPLDVQTPNYRVEFFVPADAMLSNDDRRWRIEWVMVTDEGRQSERVTEFDVRDHDVTTSETRQLKLLAMAQQRFRLPIRLAARPYDLRLNVAAEGSYTNPLVAEATYPPVSGLPELTEVVDGETYVYYYDIPAGADKLQANTVYSAIWTVQRSISAAPTFDSQTIVVPDRSLLSRMASLRMIIDKRQKALRTVQAYQDSDIVEYLQLGLNWLNGWHPQTAYGAAGVPPVLQTYWLLMSAIIGLNDQHLLEVDLAFSFSGASTTLDYDRAAGLDGAAGRMVEMLNTSLTPAKTSLFRKSQSIAITTVRPLRNRGIRGQVYRIGSTSGSGAQLDLTQLLTDFGLWI